MGLTTLWATKQPVHQADAQSDDADDPLVKFAAARTLLSVALLKDNEIIGVIGIYRQQVRPFNECPDSEVRFIWRHTRWRTSESKGHSQLIDLV